MKFPTFRKPSRLLASHRKPPKTEQPQPVPLLTWLRNRPALYAAYLPDSVRVPPIAPSRPDEVIRLLPEATIDDIAFAIQASEAECSDALRRTSALKELYEAARKHGALGTTTIAEAFATAAGESRK